MLMFSEQEPAKNQRKYPANEPVAQATNLVTVPNIVTPKTIFVTAGWNFLPTWAFCGAWVGCNSSIDPMMLPSDSQQKAYSPSGILLGHPSKIAETTGI